MKKIIFLLYIVVIAIVVIMIAPSFRYGKESRKIINKGIKDSLFFCLSDLSKVLLLDYKQDKFSLVNYNPSQYRVICEGRISFKPLDNLLEFSNTGRYEHRMDIEPYFSQPFCMGFFYHDYKAISIFDVPHPEIGTQLSSSVIDTSDFERKLKEGNKHTYVPCDRYTLKDLKGEYVDNSGSELTLSPESFQLNLNNRYYNGKIKVCGPLLILSVSYQTGGGYFVTEHHELDTKAIFMNNGKQLVVKNFLSFFNVSNSFGSNLIFYEKSYYDKVIGK